MLVQFDDDYFSEMPQKTPAGSANYSAKCCKPEWYMNDTKDEVEDEDVAQTCKCQGDQAYRLADYHNALNYYQRLLWHPNHLTPQLHREVKDSVARTHLQLGDHIAALQMALHLDEQSKTDEQRVCSWRLLAKVHHQMKNYHCEILTYTQLLQLHPQNAVFWVGLADAFALHWGVNASGVPNTSSEETAQEKASLVSGLSSALVQFILGACCIRARIIYQNYSKRLKDQGLPRLLVQYPKVTEYWLGVLPLSTQFLRTATQVLGRDIMGEKDDLSEFENLAKELKTEWDEFSEDQRTTLTLAQFYHQWFGWIHDRDW